MKGYIAVLFVICCGCLMQGCTFKLMNDGEGGFKQSTSWSFYHTAKQTSPEPSTSQTSVPALEEWLHKKTEQMPSTLAPVSSKQVIDAWAGLSEEDRTKVSIAIESSQPQSSEKVVAEWATLSPAAKTDVVTKITGHEPN